MAGTLTRVSFPPVLTAEQAWQVVTKKTPGLQPAGQRLRWHPFSGFVFAVRHPLNAGGSPKRAFTLVDRLSGQATLTDPWPQLGELSAAQAGECVPDPGWNSIDADEAALRAHRLVSTAALRRNRLATSAEITVLRAVESLWKPNWLLTGALDGRSLTILVDGINGGYYVVGS